MMLHCDAGSQSGRFCPWKKQDSFRISFSYRTIDLGWLFELYHLCPDISRRPVRPNHKKVFKTSAIWQMICYIEYINKPNLPCGKTNKKFLLAIFSGCAGAPNNNIIVNNMIVANNIIVFSIKNAWEKQPKHCQENICNLWVVWTQNPWSRWDSLNGQSIPAPSEYYYT